MLDSSTVNGKATMIKINIRFGPIQALVFLIIVCKKGCLNQKLSSSNKQVKQIASILNKRSIWQKYGF